MASVVKYSVVKNTTGAVLTSALTDVAGGQQYNLNVIKRVFAAADIGNAAGQTQNAAGCLVGQVEGCRILSVVSMMLVRPAAQAAGSVQDVILNSVTGTTANPPVFQTYNKSQFIISPDGSKVYYSCVSQNAGGNINAAAGDYLVLTLATGNTAANAYVGNV